MIQGNIWKKKKKQKIFNLLFSINTVKLHNNFKQFLFLANLIR